ncbi:MAG: hypothetical protein NVS9B15_18650 [Acidobacteriaceae bacterium]
MFRSLAYKLIVVFALSLLLTSCGGSATSSALNTIQQAIGVGDGPGTSPASIPSVKYFAIVVLENTNYSDAINSANMPFLMSLTAKGALATNYYADVHPSIGNYFEMTTGTPATIDDNFSGVVSTDNVVRELVASGKTWKEYAESIPSTGYLGGDQGAYLRRHNPFSYLSDAQKASQAGNIVPFTQLSADAAAGTLPNYIFITPDQTHDAHSCADLTTNCAQKQRLAAADRWLSTNLQPLLGNASFMTNGILVITFDESADENTNGGGKVGTVLIGSHVKAGYQSGSTAYDHRSLLSLSMKSLGVSADINGANAAPQMGEFFQ